MGGLYTALSLAVGAEPELSPTGFGTALLKMVAALVLVCVLAYLALRLARRHLIASRGKGSLLRVVERCPLSARQSLWVVEVGERFFLIGATEGSIAKLAELDHEQVARALEQGGPRKRFRDLLGKSPQEEKGGPAGRSGGADK